MTKDEAVKVLREDLKPGDTVNCILRHVSRSGMSRSISLLKGDQDITYYAGLVTENRIDQKNGGIKITGFGMDMGFALVYDLAYRLFPEGFKVDGVGRNGDTSGWDNDGGYALKYRWL
jgi:hypothetical protein